MLTRNPPDKRLAFIVKTYIDKQPWVVWDTLNVIFNTIGIDDVAEAMRSAADIGAGTPPGMDPRNYKSEVLGMQLHLPALPDPDWMFRVPVRDDWDTSTYASYMLSHSFWGSPRTGRWESLLLALPMFDDPLFADGLMKQPHEADAVFPWAAREISRLAKYAVSTLPGLKAFSARSMDVYIDYVSALGELKSRANGIAAWAKKSRIDLNKLTLADALDGSKSFKVKVAVPQGVIVKKFKTGWTVQELRGRGRLDPEGKRLQHCVGSYCQKVEAGTSQIYSLRDPDGVPYVTMEVYPATGHFEQVFGRQNVNINSPGFSDYVLSEGQANDPPLKKEDAPLVVEAIRGMLEAFIDERSGGHLQSLALAGVNLTPRVQEAIRIKSAGVDLSGLTLLKIDLSGLDLRKTVMEGAVLRGANLRGANLENANLASARLDDADLEGADMTGAQLSDATFTRANLSDAKMVAVRAANARFAEAVMQSTVLQYAYLWKADLSRTDLGGAVLRDADVSYASFMEADLRGADLIGIRGIATNVSFRGAKYNVATLIPEGLSPHMERMVRDNTPSTEEGRERAMWEAASDHDVDLFQDDSEYDELDEDEDEDDEEEW